MQCWQNQLWLWLHGRVQVAPVARAVRRRWQQQRNDNNGSSMDDSGSSDGLLEPFRNQSMGEELHSRWPSKRKGSFSSNEFAEALQQMYQRCEDLHCAVARRPEG